MSHAEPKSGARPEIVPRMNQERAITIIGSTEGTQEGRSAMQVQLLYSYTELWVVQRGIGALNIPKGHRKLKWLSCAPTGIGY